MTNTSNVRGSNMFKHYHPKVLFILKERQVSGGVDPNPYLNKNSGLYNSAKFVVDMLDKLGLEVHLVQVQDGNDIDKYVHRYKPTHVVLEAIWCPPDKFNELRKLHKNIHWVIRTHSEIPFLANEGMAIEWLFKYLKHEKVAISANSKRALQELRLLMKKAYPDWDEEMVRHKVVYLPNYYPVIPYDGSRKKPDKFLDVGCFGAIRPMKNQLMQGVAAIEAARQLRKKLRFSVNSTRVEQLGFNIMKNLQALMDNTGNELRTIPWLDHDNFVQEMDKMDVGMQVSFSETFSIVAADMVSKHLPVVVSPEITWASDLSKVNPNDSKAIASTIIYVTDPDVKELILKANLSGLKGTGEEAKEEWTFYLLQAIQSYRSFGN